MTPIHAHPVAAASDRALSWQRPRCYRDASLPIREPAVTRNVFLCLMVVAVAACTPTVKVATDQPITINLNVNIKHEIRIKVDKELDGVLNKDSGLF